MNRAFVGFGSNMGDSLSVCSRAVERLHRPPEVRVLRVSSFYETEPVGMTEQAPFLNGVLLCETALGPEDLLGAAQEIEKAFHRTREVRWGPRTLDLDILAYGGLRIALPHLIVPHPRLHERRFVLIPLLEIDPAWVHPASGEPGRRLLEAIPAEGQDVVKVRRAPVWRGSFFEEEEPSSEPPFKEEA